MQEEICLRLVGRDGFMDRSRARCGSSFNWSSGIQGLSPGGCIGAWPRFMLKVERSTVFMAEIVVFLYSLVGSIRHSLPEPHLTCGVEVSVERVVRQPSQS